MTGTDGHIRLYGLTNAALETDTALKTLLPTTTRPGFCYLHRYLRRQGLTLEGVADFQDAGYQVLRLTEQNTVVTLCALKSLVSVLPALMRLCMATVLSKAILSPLRLVLSCPGLPL